ncbi:MAG: ankyrin repeat domain-containing protein, partial [Elusimicrobiaceae bacterium]|nr:ankyrin repeat domain-containing protein [Elusimicrobiaceae bacterium]
VNARGENGITPLINSFSIVTPEAKKIRERLLKAKPDVNAVMNMPRCKKEDRIWGSYLWGEDTIFGRDPKCEPNPATALSIAVATDDVSAVEMLLKNGADVNVAFPIRSAATSSKPNSAKIVELLLKAGADPRQVDIKEVSGKDKKGLIKKAMNQADKAQQKLNNKLYEAAQKGNVEQVKKLLEKGANPNSYYFGAYDAREYYETPLLAVMHYTKDGEQALEIMKVLINAGADVNARNRSYSTALHYNYTDIEKFKLLIQSGADVNARNMYGRTPLFGAGEKNIKLYIKAGADVNARDYEGLSALFHASVSPKKHSTAELLQVHGAKLTPYEKRLLPTMQKRQQLNLTKPAETESTQQAQNDSGNGLGRTLMQGLSNAAQDTVNFAIQNAGKF